MGKGHDMRVATVTTLKQAARFIEKQGFALLFGKKGSSLPSLYDAAGRPEDWDGDMARFWGWKDELPERGLAWYGQYVSGMKSFLSPEMLRHLYPGEGRPDDFRGADLSPTARTIADELLANGPTPAGFLRELVGKKEYERAAKELFRGLVITHQGVAEQPAGWPSAVLELTARAFGVGGGDPDEAARIFFRTMPDARPRELRNALRISSPR